MKENRFLRRPLSAPDLQFVLAFAKKNLGISLENKDYLIENRLSSIVQRCGLKDLSEIVDRLRGSRDLDIQKMVLDALVTNETLFFRDTHPFEALRTSIIPEILARRHNTKVLKVWFAACSTGQEPYSFAIMIREEFSHVLNWKLSLTATDVSERALDRARKATYSDFEVGRGLTPQIRQKYFMRQGSSWLLLDSVRNMVEFQSLNLLHTIPRWGKFDIIFLRNVLIYFDRQLKKDVLTKVSGELAQDGVLILGSSESIFSLADNLERMKIPHCECYRLKQIKEDL